MTPSFDPFMPDPMTPNAINTLRELAYAPMGTLTTTQRIIVTNSSDTWEADLKRAEFNNGRLAQERDDAVMAHHLAEARLEAEQKARFNDAKPFILQITALQNRVRELRTRLESAENRNELAWGIIANSPDWGVPDDGSPCGERAKTWREAATRWRDRYHAALAGEEKK